MALLCTWYVCVCIVSYAYRLRGSPMPHDKFYDTQLVSINILHLFTFKEGKQTMRQREDQLKS